METNDIPRESVRIQEIGDYWRKQGQDFLISKQLDITLQDFKQIDAIVKHVDTRGIRTNADWGTGKQGYANVS